MGRILIRVYFNPLIEYRQLHSNKVINALESKIGVFHAIAQELLAGEQSGEEHTEVWEGCAGHYIAYVTTQMYT